MCDFPLMNLNVHACYLLSVIKILGIEAKYDSLIIDPRIENESFSFKSPLLSIIATNEQFMLEFFPKCCINLKIKIRKPNWWSKDSLTFLNGLNITRETDFLTMDKRTLIIKIVENYEKISILIKK